jgi:DNA-binding NtrC family response regulator
MLLAGGIAGCGIIPYTVFEPVGSAGNGEAPSTYRDIWNDGTTGGPGPWLLRRRTMAGKLEILLLDDEPIVGKRLKPALAKIGCNVEVFEDPRQALDRIHQKTFDIVVTDIRMDGIDGLEILEHVLRKSPRTKVIMITGYAMMAVAREAMEKGAYDFISKPFTPDDLRKVIAMAAQALGSPIDSETADPEEPSEPAETR